MDKDFKKLCKVLSKPKYSEAIYNILFDDVGVNFDDALLITKYIEAADKQEQLADFACLTDDDIKFELAYINEEAYTLCEEKLHTKPNNYFERTEQSVMRRLLKEQYKAIPLRNKIFEALNITKFSEITRKRIIDQVYLKYKTHRYVGKNWYLQVFNENEWAEYRIALLKADKEKDYSTIDFIFNYDNHYYMVFLRNKSYKGDN